MEAEQSIDAYNEEVRLGNEEFERLEPAGKRIAIAKDVLRQLDTKKIVASPGDWIRCRSYGYSSNDLMPSGFSAHEDESAADLFENIESCNVCALGAIFYSTVTTARNARVRDMRDMGFSGARLTGTRGPLFMTYLGEFFDQDQMRLLEMAFEKGRGWFEPAEFEPAEFEPAENVAAKMFTGARAYWSPDRRLRALMENIIRNYGNFDPLDQRGLNLLEAAKETT